MPVSKIACFGMLELTTDINMPAWLSSWKQVLQPNGVLIVQLNPHYTDLSWRETARRYAEIASPLGFELVSVNGCDVGWGALHQSCITPAEKARIATVYNNLSVQAGVHGRHRGLCHNLTEVAKRVGSRGALTVKEVIGRDDGLYGVFTQCHAQPWADY